MKVFEKINELKGTSCDLKTIASWFYSNRFYPIDILIDNALELDLDVKLPEDFKNILRDYSPKVFMNGMEPLIEMLNIELEAKEVEE